MDNDIPVNVFSVMGGKSKVNGKKKNVWQIEKFWICDEFLFGFYSKYSDH